MMKNLKEEGISILMKKTSFLPKRQG